MLARNSTLIAKSKENVEKSIQTVEEACTVFNRDTIINKYGLADYNYKAEKYALNVGMQNPFAICPVFFDNDEDDINICALCFALLITSKGNEYLKHTDRNSKTLINCLINTIVISALEDKNNAGLFYWPTKISVTKIVESGTCNQTTVALSALLRVGFLKETDDVPEKALKERYKLIIGALSWLIKNQNSESEENAAWSYGENCTTVDGLHNEITYATLSSHFCYETIRKYIGFFDSPMGRHKWAADVNPYIMDDMHRACHRFEEWVERKLATQGYFSKTNLSESTPSLLHTCLCQIIYFFNNTDDLDIDKYKKTVDYVIKNIGDLTFGEKELLESYQFNYKTSDGSEGHKVDIYEIVPEYLFIDYSTRLLKCNYSRYLSRSQEKKLKEANYIAYDNLLKKIKYIDFNDHKKSLVLQGIQSDPRKYPIYGLYDLQLCLLELLGSSDGKRDIPIIGCPIMAIRKNILISLPFIIIGLILLLYAATVNFESTVINALTTGAFALLGASWISFAIKEWIIKRMQ